MNNDNLQKNLEFEVACKDLENTLKEKNSSYGSSFYNTMKKYGDVTLLIRLNDKIQRLESLILNNKEELVGESIRDTLKDIAGYAVLGEIYFRNYKIREDVVNNEESTNNERSENDRHL